MTTADVDLGFFVSSAWVGGVADASTLSGLWEQAKAAAAIGRYGLYMSEHNRLGRIAAGATAGDVATERRELDKFISAVSASGEVASPWRQRVLGYAVSLRSTLGG